MLQCLGPRPFFLLEVKVTYVSRYESMSDMFIIVILVAYRSGCNLRVFSDRLDSQQELDGDVAGLTIAISKSLIVAPCLGGNPISTSRS